MNLKTAARRLGVHYQTAYRWVRSGQLVAVKVGAGYEISEAALARFEAQRDAMERVPESDGVAWEPAPADSFDAALVTLDRMLDGVTLDPSPVIQRAVRVAADVLGDGAIVSLRSDDDEFEVAEVAHHDPVIELKVASIARDVPFTRRFARMVAQAGGPVFTPQVRQRDVRRCLRPELHEHLMEGSCFSLICVPIERGERVEGTFLIVRNSPGRPFTSDDVALVEALAHRVSLAQQRAHQHRAAWDARQRTALAVQPLALTGTAIDTVARAVVERAIADGAGDDPQAALAMLDLELRHVGVTESYTALLGLDSVPAVGTALSDVVVDRERLERALAHVFDAELDFRTVPVQSRLTGARVVLHAAMVRRADATPWCVVVAAHDLAV